MGADGTEAGGVRYKHRYEVSISVIGSAKPTAADIPTLAGVTGGAVVVTEVSEEHSAEDFTKYNITATIYPDMAA